MKFDFAFFIILFMVYWLTGWWKILTEPIWMMPVYTVLILFSWSAGRRFGRRVEKPES